MMMKIAPFGAIGGRCGLACEGRQSDKRAGLVMRAGCAPVRTDRMSVGVMMLAGVLCGVAVFVVALPLAFSSPFPAPPQREWIVHTSTRERTSSSFEVMRPASVELVAAPTGLDEAPLSFAARWTLAEAVAEEKSEPPKKFQVAALSVPVEATGSIGAVPAALPKRIEPPAVVLPPKKRDVMEEVDQYLWEVYRRSPVKSD